MASAAYDKTRNDGLALSRMSNQLSALAQTLARLVEDDRNDGRGALRDMPVSFQPMPSTAPQSFAPVDRTQAGTDPREIREIIRLRRLRDQFFKPELFGDPGWDILLDLMAARLEHRNVSVSSLCIAAAVPPTTALRWIQRMTVDGLLQRCADPHDARRVYISLSDDTAARMADYLYAEVHLWGRL